MKKLYIIALIVVLCFSLCFSITEYWSEAFWDNSIYYTPSSFRKVCFASVYNCKNYIENTEINIPNEVDGYKVIAIGGNVGSGSPSPFVINIPNITSICEEASLPDDAEVKDYNFILNIGDNVRSIKVSDLKSYYQIGESNEYIRLTFEINTSNNKFFYSHEGKLYMASDNSLIDVFTYQEK